MPREFQTFVETDRFNRSEFERQGRRYAKQQEDFGEARQLQRFETINNRTNDRQPPKQPPQVPPSRSAGDRLIPAHVLTTALEKASAVSHVLPEAVVNKIAENIPDAMKSWVSVAAAAAAQVPRSTSGQDEPVFELTRHQLATMIDGNTRYLMYQRDLEEWYQRKISSGTYDVRLEQYAFRSATYDQQLARLTREMKMAEEKLVVPRLGEPSIVEADAEPKRPKLIQPDTLNPIALIVRIKVKDMGRVVVWDRGDGIYELTEKAQNVSAGMSIMKNNSCIDLLGSPDEATTVALDFGDLSFQLTIDARYVIIGDRYVVCDTGEIELPGRQQRDTDWQLQFVERSGPQNFELRYKAKYFKLELSEAGVRVTPQKKIN